MYSSLGAYGPVDRMLFPVHHGILHFVGFTIVEPFVVYGPSKMNDAQRSEELRRFRARMLNLDRAPSLPDLDLAEYDGLVRKSTNADCQS
jgi:NAD(P)H dehydrogenase (quinone)